MGLRGKGSKKTRPPKNLKKLEGRWSKDSQDRVARVIAFLESLPVTKGILAGQLVKLLPSQKTFLKKIYGSKKRIRIGVKSEPRGNGKTGLVAGLALCHLLGPEAEPRGEIYSAAIDRQQAALIFAEMEAIIQAVPQFHYRCNIIRFHKKIEVLDGEGKGSTYEALSADARRGHGLAPSLWIYDELAQAKDRELLDNLVTAMGKRKRALGLIISTQAPESDHPLSLLIDEGLAGVDPSVVVDLLCAPEHADPFDPEVIRACNPALGHFLNETDVFADADRARRMPQFEPAFRNRRLNQRIDPDVEGRLCTIVEWKKGEERDPLEAFEGRTCYGGLDLSVKHDLTAFVLVFPDEEEEPGYDVFPFFWTPQGQLGVRPEQERTNFQTWIRQGHMVAVPGEVVRYHFVAQTIAQMAHRFDLRMIAYDKWRIEDLKADLADLEVELPLEGFGQGHTKEMGPGVQYFVECLKSDPVRIRHGGHPVLTACVVNAVLTLDKAGNPIIDRPKSNKRGPVRIDGAVALVMALQTARRYHTPVAAGADELMVVY